MASFSKFFFFREITAEPIFPYCCSIENQLQRIPLCSELLLSALLSKRASYHANSFYKYFPTMKSALIQIAVPPEARKLIPYLNNLSDILLGNRSVSIVFQC